MPTAQQLREVLKAQEKLEDLNALDGMEIDNIRISVRPANTGRSRIPEVSVVLFPDHPSYQTVLNAVTGKVTEDKTAQEAVVSAKLEAVVADVQAVAEAKVDG